MAFEAKQWAKVQALYEGGFSLGQIVSRSDVVIKDRGLISKRARKHGWKQGNLSTLVDMELANIREKNSIEIQKSTLGVENALSMRKSFKTEYSTSPHCLEQE